MRVIVDMEIETPDYGGREFKEEIEKLIKNIDPSGKSKLVKFKMRDKYGCFDDPRDYEWRIE
jgi:hypothetical protein